MYTWRPAPTIRVKALGLHWRDGRLLATPVYNDDGQLKGVRPLGGTVEFGETWQQALTREFKEELDQDISIISEPLVMENIYSHEGDTGHELLFIAQVDFAVPPNSAYEGIEYSEDDGSNHIASWYELDKLKAEKIVMFPEGLLEKITSPSESTAVD